MRAVQTPRALTSINVPPVVLLYFIDRMAVYFRRETMTYATLMVHLQLGQSNAGRLHLAGDLAERFKARVIGIAACQPQQIIYDMGYCSEDVINQCRNELNAEIETAEAEFHAALHPRVSDLSWRSSITMKLLPDYLAEEARSADLLITSLGLRGSLFDMNRYVDIGDLVMQAGRPVLVVPDDADTPKFGTALVGWKDTREARRAVADALPLLQQAAHVHVVEIAAEDDMEAARLRVADVVAWLQLHGVTAEAVALRSTGHDDSSLNGIAQHHGADLIVAGAYGHSRLREWVLGGMTRNLIQHADRCTLLSH